MIFKTRSLTILILATVLLTTLCLVGLAPAALAQEPMVVRFESLRGPASRSLERGLADALTDANDRALRITESADEERVVRISGRARRRGRRLMLRLRVEGEAGVDRDVRGRARATGRPTARLARRLRSAVEEVWEQSGFDDVIAPEPEPVVEELADPEPDELPEIPVAVATGGEGRPSASKLELGFSIVTRRFAYQDDLFSNLRAYDLPGAPSLRARFLWYPLAHFGPSIGALFGLDLRAEHMVFTQSDQVNAELFPTLAYNWQAGLRGRLLAENLEGSVGLAFGEQAFLIQPSGPATPAMGNIAPLPGVAYRYLRPDLRGGLELMDLISIEAEAGFRIVVDSGPLSQQAWFPRNTTMGADVALSVGLSITSYLSVSLGARYIRYFSQMNSQLGDTQVAGGASDEYLNFDLNLELRDPGER